MELFLVLLFFCLRKKHHQGFSHIEFPDCHSVFFFSSRDDLDIYINGEYTGVTGPSFLYFPDSMKSFVVEYKKRGLSFFSEEVHLVANKLLVRGPITPVLKPKAISQK